MQLRSLVYTKPSCVQCTATYRALAAADRIERRPHPHDRRARVVVLTARSRREFFAHFGAHLNAMSSVIERYSDEELAIAARMIGELSEAIDPR